MNNTIVVKSPFKIKKENRDYNKIFLAGAINQGKSEDWQKEITELISLTNKSKNILILNPRRDDWDSSWKQVEENIEFNYQVNWELAGLEESDLIVMYFSKENESIVSMLELGKFIDSGKLIVYCPKEYMRSGNVYITCKKYNVPCYKDYEEFKKGLLKMIDQKFV